MSAPDDMPSDDAMLFWIHPDGRFLDANEAACAFLGYRREELCARCVWDIDHDFPSERWPEHWRELREARRLRFRSVHHRGDGTPIEVEVCSQYLDFGGQEHSCALVYPLSEQRRATAELRESTERLALALDVAGQALYELWLDSGRRILTHAHRQLLERDLPELAVSRDTWTSWVHPDDQERISALVADCVAGRYAETAVDFRVRSGSGRWIWIRSVARVIEWDRLGRPLRMLGTHLDITETKEAEEALKLTQLIVDRAFVGIFCIDVDGKLVYVNDEGCRSLGYDREELIGVALETLDPSFDPARPPEAITRLRARRTQGEQSATAIFETRHRRKDGTLFPVEVAASYILVGDKEYRYAFVRDLTSRKAAEEALRASEALLGSIIGQSPLPLLIVDRTGAIVRSNQAALALFDAYEDPAVLEGYNLFQDERLRAGGQLTKLARVLDAGETLRFDNRFETCKGVGLELDSTIFPIRDAAGQITHAVVYHLDITELKAKEAKLRYHLDSEQALADISALMIKPGWGDLDERLAWMLERIGRLTQAERSFVFLIARDGRVASNTHEWCAPGMASQRADLQDLPTSDYQAFYERLRRGEVVKTIVTGSEEPMRFKPQLLEPGTHALICLPISWEGRLRGFLGLDALTRKRPWSDVDVRFLRMVAEILAHTLQHRASDRALRLHADHLESLDRISRALTRTERDTTVLKTLAEEMQEIFTADRAFLLHPCDPEAASLALAMEVTKAEHPGAFAAERVIELDDTFRSLLRQALDQSHPVLTSFAPSSVGFREHGICSQMAIALRPQTGSPWLLGLQQCSRARQWTEREQRLFQSIAERVGEALSGHLLLEQLQASETRYRAVFDNALDAIIVHDARGKILAVNQAMLGMFGLEESKALRQWIPDITGPEHPEEAALALYRRVLEGEITRSEWTAMRPRDGARFPVEVMLRAIRFGETPAILANVRDVSERKRAEEALRRSEERFAKAFRSSPAPMLVSTIDEGRIIDANDRWLSLFGRERAQWIGRTTLEAGVWRDPAARECMIARLRESGPFQNAPVVIHTAEGEPRDVLWSTEIIVLEDEPVLLSAVHDLTEQKRADQARRESEARLSAAIESMPFDFFILDLDERYVLQNSSSRARWGEVIGKRPRDAAVHRGLAAVWQSKLQRVLSGEVVDEELQLDVGDETRFFRDVLSPVQEGEHVRGILELTTDITDRRRAEEELAQHREHLEDLVTARTDELQRAMAQLVQAEKLAALGSLVAGVAHELNTPLGNARMVASTLSDDLKALSDGYSAGALRRAQLSDFIERGQEAVALLERNTVRAASLIQHFKEVAVDQTSVRRRPFDLRRTIEEVLATLHPTLKRTAHHIALEVPPGIELDSYPGPLEQVVSNLVGNSLVHGFAEVPSGRIRIQASAGPDSVLIRYSDNGPGIPAEAQARIFDPFFTTRLGQGGSGLGLYIVYNLVTGLLGGVIALVDDSDDAGARFQITLPLRAPIHND